MIFLCIAFTILFGAFCAFLSAILTSLSQEKLNNIIDSKTKASARLHSLRTNIENSNAGFTIIENLSYTAAYVLFGIVTFNNYQGWLITIIGILVIFNLVLFIRSLFFAFGRRYADNLAGPLSGLLYLFAIIPEPLIESAKYIIHKIGGNPSEDASRHELNAMVETAREEGSIEPDEYRILKNIMNFREVLVSDVMTPRTVVFSCEADNTVGEIVNLTEMQMYSRFPIWEGESMDDGVVGYVMTKDVIYAALQGNSSRMLRGLARKVYYIPENAELDKALDEFLKRKQHLFIVVDEYGGVEGLLTMEDVLETILGVEIVDEADKVVDLRELAKQHRDKRIASLTQQSENI
jgi:CBS domain containing-hemolysin-like protein